MASYGYTFVSGDTLTPTKLNNARTVSDIVNADIKSDAAIAHSKLATMTAGNILLGNATAVPTSTAVTGDVTISNAGVTAISAGVILDADISSTANIALSKLATGALPTAITVASANIVNGTIVNEDISNTAAITHTKLANITAGQVLMGNASNAPTATALSGDVTVNSSGVTAIGSGVIVDADVNASAAIALSKLATGALPTAITVTTGNMVNASVTQAKLGTNVASNGPAFRAYAGTTTTAASGAWTIVNFNSEDFDTNNNFASNVFTPTVAGYYQINAAASIADPYAANAVLAIYKNADFHSIGVQIVGTTYRVSISDIVYCNGTTDAIDIRVSHVAGGNRTVEARSDTTYFSGVLVRAA